MSGHDGTDGGRLRVLVVDDEPLARRAVVDCLRQDGELRVVGECGDGLAAVEAVRREPPDLLVLDVQMPGADGFEVLRQLDPASIPYVVFVTAYDEYAVAAFEQQALDYVLKPFSDRRLRQALERAKARIRGDDLRALGRRVLDLAQAEPADRTEIVERLAVPKGERTLLVPVAEVDWFEAADYYVRLHVGEASHLLRKPLKWLERRLDPARFVRIHRSAIANVDRVREIRRLGPGDHVVVLPGERLVPLSRSGREALARLLD